MLTITGIAEYILHKNGMIINCTIKFTKVVLDISHSYIGTVNY